MMEKNQSNKAGSFDPSGIVKTNTFNIENRSS